PGGELARAFPREMGGRPERAGQPWVLGVRRQRVRRGGDGDEEEHDRPILPDTRTAVTRAVPPPIPPAFLPPPAPPHPPGDETRRGARRPASHSRGFLRPPCGPRRPGSARPGGAAGERRAPDH